LNFIDTRRYVLTHFHGIGIRRRKDNITLDVLYIDIRSAESEYSKVFSKNLTEHVITVLSQDQLSYLPEHVSTLIHHNTLDPSYGSADVIYIKTDPVTGPIESVEDAYLRLHLLSKRLVKPHDINLGNLFQTLHNLAWTSIGPILVQDLEYENAKRFGSSEPLTVYHVDKFPYLVNYTVPHGVRIASGSQVRLGAYLGEGTTVMPAGYINFNAGTMGNAMVEGRVSAGVVVDEDTDLGGGASIMGTLSGGNSHVISVGKRCLLGANSGIGISLGDDCTVAAGLYIYAGMKISLLNEDKQPITLDGKICNKGENIIKAAELSGKSNCLYIQDSVSGNVFCMPNKSSIQLNESLHQND